MLSIQPEYAEISGSNIAISEDVGRIGLFGGG
jgi:hypothetical protein